jgi:hypothetical protein
MRVEDDLKGTALEGLVSRKAHEGFLRELIHRACDRKDKPLTADQSATLARMDLERLQAVLDDLFDQVQVSTIDFDGQGDTAKSSSVAGSS